jgi:Allene oxide cyclase barrel like domain
MAEPAAPQSLVFTDHTERTLRFESVGSGDPRMQPGDGATFYNEICDPAGTVVGHTVGMVVAVSRRDDGAVLTEYTEVIQLPGGTLHSTATVDRGALLRAEPVTLEVVGIGGAFLGRKGTRECQVIPPLTDGRVRMTIVLPG